MIRKIFVLSLLFFALVTSSQTLNLRVFTDMTNTYITSSKHFNFIYKKDLSNEIKNIVKISEGVYDTLKKIMKCEPPNRINLLITDQSDLPNGFSTPILNPTVNIYLANPDPTFIAKHENWVEYVLLHELTHTFHLTKTNPKFLSKMQNSCLYLPSVAQPMYFLEGYTVYNESTVKSGRLKDTYFEAILRTFFLESRKPPLDRAISYFDTEYPYGMLPYIYGPYIFDKMEEISKKDLSYITQIDPFTCLPFHILFPDIFFLIKNSYLPSTLLKLVYQDVEKKTKKLRENYTISEREKIFEDDNESSLPAFHKGKLYFIESYYHKRSRMVEYSNKKKKELFTLSYTTKFKVTDDFIIFDMLDIYDNVSYFFSIYTFDFKTKNIKKLPHTLRGFSPETYGDTLFFIRNKTDKNLLIIYSLKEEKVKDSIEFPSNYRFYSLTTKNGKDLLLSVYREGGYTDIMFFDVEKRFERFLTTDRATDFLPLWSEKDDGFYFLSDRDGLNTLFYFNLDSNRIYPRFRTLYNISNYDIDEVNNTLYFQDLTKDGDKIFKGKLENFEDKNYNLQKVEYKNYVPISKETSYSIKSKRYILPEFSGPGTYFFLPLFLPLFNDSVEIEDYLFLFPFFNVNSDISQSLSFITYGIFSFTHNVKDFSNSIQYYNSSQITLSQLKNDIFFSYDILNEGKNLGIKKYLPENYSLSGGMIFNDLKFKRTISLSPSFSILKNDSLKKGGFYLDLYFSKSESSTRSIIPSEGLKFNTNLYFSKILNDSFFDKGLDLKIQIFKSPNWRLAFFGIFETFLTENDSVEVLRPSLYGKMFLEKAKLKYTYFDEANLTSFSSKNLNIVKLGFLYTLVNINRGIPINIFISSPIKFSFLTISFNHSEGYSIDTNLRLSHSKFSINLVSDLFALGTVAPGIFLSYDHIIKKPNFGLTLSLF
ncbi:MAG: WD-40 repeat-containing protein [candidate division TA06 bacterium 32_111]|uniref:WD-40 repeat-containing protein n=2 Tax=Bacteria candidate phyla TaxID=1783234 RepID=A0A101I3D0_UNCT6|nr:MAG: WD-40 repeat-containing protein [candidate division TA06 bacterium 32_111]KUK88206.1 MAG: WD-40 repeat-containing protein [candidate division TA06 bacterium 34_109]HAF07139.1 hypothetical protein [candidate division WOR-3 bacterium]HCP15990.1 hypothetical protein [candidate division WOR-3 bacterium]